MHKLPPRAPETPDCPKWLRISTPYDESPFHRVTREHLRKRGAREPEVFALIERLQDKDAANPGEGSREWHWAKRISFEDQQVLRDLHAHFKADDALDILSLAAYASDHSYAHFFSNYAARITAGNLQGDERRLYNETLQRITPIVAQLQPSVAIGFAPQIFEVYQHLKQPEEALAIFTELARKHPFEVLSKPERFVEMPSVLAAAEKASTYRVPSAQEVGFARAVTVRAEIAATIARQGRG